jgi:hypothetical protein
MGCCLGELLLELIFGVVHLLWLGLSAAWERASEWVAERWAERDERR